MQIKIIGTGRSRKNLHAMTLESCWGLSNIRKARIILGPTRLSPPLHKDRLKIDLSSRCYNCYLHLGRFKRETTDTRRERPPAESNIAPGRAGLLPGKMSSHSTIASLQSRPVFTSRCSAARKNGPALQTLRKFLLPPITSIKICGRHRHPRTNKSYE